MTVFQVGDRVGLIGEVEEIQAAEKLLSESEVISMNQPGLEWET